MAPINPGVRYEGSWLECNHINTPAVKRQALKLSSKPLPKDTQIAWLLRAVSCIDLTTLAGDDTPCNVTRLCYKAKHCVRQDILKQLGPSLTDLHTGAVCVYPNQVAAAKKALQQAGVPQIPIASVATGFPCGQTPLAARLIEIRQAVKDGASEIDVVINRTLALTGKWEEMYNELREMKEACGDAHMKVILAIGELSTFTNVYKASIVAMMAGGDFIKTSTGKEGVNAILPVGLVMARAIEFYVQKTKYKVGLKPAGGIRTCSDALSWLVMMKEVLGDEWTKPELFRIGASGLLGDIEKCLYTYVKGHPPSPTDLAMC